MNNINSNKLSYSGQYMREEQSNPIKTYLLLELLVLIIKNSVLYFVKES